MVLVVPKRNDRLNASEGVAGVPSKSDVDVKLIPVRLQPRPIHRLTAVVVELFLVLSERNSIRNVYGLGVYAKENGHAFPDP